MEGSRGVLSNGGGGGRKAALETEDLQEEEVWAVMKGREDSYSNSKTRKNYVTGPSSSPSSAWRLARTPRSIPRATADGGGNQDFSATKLVAPPHSTSAPVAIPDWSKILKKRSKKNLWDDACDADDNDDDGGCGYHGGRRCRHDIVGEVENDDDGLEMVPPHEYLARRVAGTQIASFSMLEGVGRTLKGRDLSKLRNAILTKTGFIE